MKKVILLMFFLLISFVSADGNSDEINIGIFKQNECVDLYNYCPTCTYINLTAIQLPNGTLIKYNLGMNKTDDNYIINYCNTSLLGEYSYTTCGNKGEAITACEDIKFTITPSGKLPDTSSAIINIILFVFFISLVVGIYFLNRNIDFEKWNNSIYNKYENKNYIKLIFSSISYNIMKNCFIIYYLLIFPILLLIMNISYEYGIVSMIEFFPVLIIIYSVGAIIVGIYFLGFVQEWFMKLLEDIKNMEWGI